MKIVHEWISLFKEEIGPMKTSHKICLGLEATAYVATIIWAGMYIWATKDFSKLVALAVLLVACPIALAFSVDAYQSC